MPGGENDYLASLACSARSIYQKLSSGAMFFVDKTPRYYLILEEIHQMFPDALFIYLYRNPLSIFASSIEAFCSNKARRLDHLDRDFWDGPGLISKSFALNQSDILKVSYEETVLHPEETMSKVCMYMGLNFEKKMIENFSLSKINGQGDALGIGRYNYLNDNTKRWKILLSNSYRKFRATQYIKNIDSRYLDQGGYDRDVLLFELKNHNPSFASSEWIYFVEEKIIRCVKKMIKYQILA